MALVKIYRFEDSKTGETFESPAKAVRKPRDSWDVVSDKKTKQKRRLQCLLKSFAV